MKRKGSYSLRVYVPVEKEGCVKEFIEICKRENDSAAKKVLEFIEKYVDQHKNGNPQLLIQHFFKPLRETLRKCSKLRKEGYLEGRRGWCLLRERWVTKDTCRRCGRVG